MSLHKLRTFYLKILDDGLCNKITPSFEIVVKLFVDRGLHVLTTGHINPSNIQVVSLSSLSQNMLI
jgi:hypothetical protein